MLLFVPFWVLLSSGVTLPWQPYISYISMDGPESYGLQLFWSAMDRSENVVQQVCRTPHPHFPRCVCYSGSVLWNSLSLAVRQLTSPSIFKGKLTDINFD